MASFTLTGLPSSTSFSVYKRQNTQPPATPPGAPVTTQTSGTDGSLTLSNLDDGVDYAAIGAGQYISFRTPAESRIPVDIGDVTLPTKRGSLVPKGYAQITVSSAAVGLGAIPSGAVFADITLNGPLRWRDDGSNPTASVGVPENIGLFYDGSPLAALRLIRAGSIDVVADIAFYA